MIDLTKIFKPVEDFILMAVEKKWHYFVYIGAGILLIITIASCVMIVIKG